MENRRAPLIILSAVFSICVFSIGCAHRTEYAPYGENGGYRDKDISDRLTVARFAGNAYTHPRDARLFSQFRALEICRSRGRKIARIWGIEDRSSSKTVQHTATYNYQAPAYFSGTANSTTNRRSYGQGTDQYNTDTSYSGSIYGGGSQSQSSSWNETFIFPTFDTFFSCTDTVYMTKIKMREISEQDMKPYVKDLMGGVQIETFTDDSPNSNSLSVGDIIIKVNGERIRNVPQYGAAVDAATDRDNLRLTVIRDGREIFVNGKSVDVSDMFENEARDLISSACSVPEVQGRKICTLPPISPIHSYRVDKADKKASEKVSRGSIKLTDPVGAGKYCKVFSTGVGSCDYNDLKTCTANLTGTDEACLPRN